MKPCVILSTAFSASTETIVWFLSLILLMWCITLINFIHRPILASLGHGVWSFHYTTRFGLLVFCSGFLHICSSGISTIVLFSCGAFVCLWYQGKSVLIKWVWKSFLLFSFWEEFEKDWHYTSLNFDRINQWSHLVLDFSLLGGFWLLIQSPLYIVRLYLWLYLKLSHDHWLIISRIYI